MSEQDSNLPVGPETAPSAEIDPLVLAKSTEVIAALGFGDYANAVLEYEGQRMTFAEGLAQHWDQVSKMDGSQIYAQVAGYVQIYDAQQAKQQGEASAEA